MKHLAEVLLRTLTSAASIHILFHYILLLLLLLLLPALNPIRAPFEFHSNKYYFIGHVVHTAQAKLRPAITCWNSLRSKGFHWFMLEFAVLDLLDYCGYGVRRISMHRSRPLWC